MKKSTCTVRARGARIALAIAAITAATASHAATTVVTAPDFTGPPIYFDSSYSETVATFDFPTVAVNDITSFTISGAWGNQSQIDDGYLAGSANSTLYANGIAIATCHDSDACYDNGTGPVAWSFTLDPSQYAAFDGHISIVAAVGEDGYIFGANTLSDMQVSITAVPEPTSLALMLGGLGALALGSRRRARSRHLDAAQVA